jgi:hypothetical protein
MPAYSVQKWRITGKCKGVSLGGSKLRLKLQKLTTEQQNQKLLQPTLKLLIVNTKRRWLIRAYPFNSAKKK